MGSLEAIQIPASKHKHCTDNVQSEAFIIANQDIHCYLMITKEEVIFLLLCTTELLLEGKLEDICLFMLSTYAYVV